MQRVINKLVRLGNKVALSSMRVSVSTLSFLHVGFYMRLYVRYLRYAGIQFNGVPKFISPDVYFDGSDYSLIYLGDNLVISREVMFLTHDYALTAGLAAVGQRKRRGEGELYVLKPITVGNDCFIGARASLLPGAHLGNNVIIGAGSVVSGCIPDNSIAVGNPCRVIRETATWANVKLSEGDYSIEGVLTDLGGRET